MGRNISVLPPNFTAHSRLIASAAALSFCHGKDPSDATQSIPSRPPSVTHSYFQNRFLSTAGNSLGIHSEYYYFTSSVYIILTDFTAIFKFCQRFTANLF